MYKRNGKWVFVMLGVAAGVLVYMLFPAEWLLFLMCAIIVYICIMFLNCR